MFPFYNLTAESRIPYMTRVATEIAITILYKRAFFDIWCIHCNNDCTVDFLNALPENLSYVRQYRNCADYGHKHIKFAVYCKSCTIHHCQDTAIEACKIYDAVKKIDPSLTDGSTPKFVHYAIEHYPRERMVPIKKVITLALLANYTNITSPTD